MKFSLNDKAKRFSWFPRDKFLNLILFFPEIGSSVFGIYLQPDTLVVNFEVQKLHLCM